jgi:hypothetical protein
MFEVKVKLQASGRDYFSDEKDYTLEGAVIKTVGEIVEMMEKDKRKLQSEQDFPTDEDFEV